MFEPIEAVIKLYFQGYLKAEPETLSKAFHPASRLFSVADGNLETVEISEWLKSLEERRQKRDIREADTKIESIEVSGNAAVVRTSLIFKTFRFTDYLSLININGDCKI